MNIDSVGIIGGGAWGTALAQVMHAAGRRVMLWAREPEVVESINARHVNEMFLSGVTLANEIKATGELADVAACDVLLMVTPAQHVRATARALHSLLRKAHPLIMCAKGIEQATGLMMGDVVAAELPDAAHGVLSGPSFAADVARGRPAALTIACADEELGQLLAEKLSSPRFRLYWSSDVVGVELGGALKNVMAIAAGIVAGRELGASAHAALVTRGFAEMRRLGAAMGAQPETLDGLSGLGDLILTCGSPQSRNMSLGQALGRGATLAQALQGKLAVTEGIYTAIAVGRLAAEKGVDMPISAAVCDVVEGRLSVQDAIEGLIQRPLKAED